MAEEDPVDLGLAEALRDECRAEREGTLLGPESPEGRELALAVGANVRRLRNERGLTLAQLAARTSIRADMLARLEEGGAVPSLRALWHLATGLEVPFGSLLADTFLARGGSLDFRIQGAERGRVIFSANGLFRSRVLFREGDPRTPEVYELSLQPGCREDAAAHAENVFEHITVISGHLEIEIGSGCADLGPGDSLFFRADKPHSYRNTGLEPTVALLVMNYATP